MRKTFVLEELGCANCAAKMEEAVARLDGVKHVSINFFSQKMVLEADDAQFGGVLKQAEKIMHKIEPDVLIVGA